MFLHLSVSHSVHRGGEYLGRYTPPPGQLHPPGQVHSLGRYTPQADTPPRAGTPPWTGTPPRQVHPLSRYTPSEQCMLGDTGNKRAVRILLECILVNTIYLRIAFLFIVISFEHVIFVPSFYPCRLCSRNLTDIVYNYKKSPSSSWILS